MYARFLENDLKNWSKGRNRKPLIVNGVRQVGKTSLLKKFGSENFEQCHTINFELSPTLRLIFEATLNPQSIVESLSFHFGQKINLENDLLFFDEIQACPKALNSLKYFNENLPQLAVCAAGSLLGVTLSPEPFPVGKVDELTLFPLSFAEFLSAIGEKLLLEALEKEDAAESFPIGIHEKLWNFWKHYLVVGGLPEVVQQYEREKNNLVSAFQAVREKQLLLINEYLRDMAKHSGNANARHLERVFRSIPAQLAKTVDDSVSRFRFTGVVPGVSQYSRLVSAFDWLQRAGLMLKVPIIDSVVTPLTQHVKESFFKAYLFDVGLMGALGEISPKELIDFQFGTYKGYVAENYVAQALKTSGIKNLYAWNEKTAEIEFLVSAVNGILPVEVKAGSVKQAKSLGIFIKRYKPERAYIFGATTPRDDKPNDSTTVHRRPIYAAGIGELGKI